MRPSNIADPICLLVVVALTALSPGPSGWADAERDSPDSALGIADLFARNGDWDQAITEYKRYLFFNENEDLVSSIHAKIADCYQAQDRRGEAIFHLRRSVQAASSLKELEQREFDLIAALVADGRDGEAERHLLGLRRLSRLDANRLSLYLCVVHVYRGDWDKGAEELRRAFRAGETVGAEKRQEIENLELLFAEARGMRRKSPGGSVWLSTALPGVGQLYAGDPWDALNAFAVNVGLAALIYAAVRQEWYVEGALLFLYPFRRYYLGNRENARTAAELRNLAADDQYRRRIMDGILSLLEIME